MKTILLANSQKEFSKDLFAMLECKYEGVNLFVVNAADDMAKSLKKRNYDLAIVNSDMNMLALSKELIIAGISIPILMYAETNNLPYIKKLYKLGVSGVLDASSGDHEVLKAVADVFAKKIYLSEKLKQDLIKYSKVANGGSGELDENCLLNQSCVDSVKKNDPFAFIYSSVIVHVQCLN